MTDHIVPEDRLREIEALVERDDPDETEGRKLYRARANALASAQVNFARRRVSLKSQVVK